MRIVSSAPTSTASSRAGSGALGDIEDRIDRALDDDAQRAAALRPAEANAVDRQEQLRPGADQPALRVRRRPRRRGRCRRCAACRRRRCGRAALSVDLTARRATGAGTRRDRRLSAAARRGWRRPPSTTSRRDRRRRPADRARAGRARAHRRARCAGRRSGRARSGCRRGSRPRHGRRTTRPDRRRAAARRATPPRRARRDRSSSRVARTAATAKQRATMAGTDMKRRMPRNGNDANGADGVPRRRRHYDGSTIRPMNADLHCHSTVSDGTLEPEALAARAKANGVELWALTDHDELGGQQRAPGRRARGRPALPQRRRDLGDLPRHHRAHRRPRHRQRRRAAAPGPGRDARRPRGARPRDGRRAGQGRHHRHLRRRAALRRQPRPDLAHALRAPPGRQRRLRRHAGGLPPLPRRRQARLRAAPLGDAEERGHLDRRRRRHRRSSPTRRATSSRRPRSTRSSPSSRATAGAASRS